MPLRSTGDARLYLISKNGAKRIGARWPVGAKYSPRDDRFAIIYEDGKTDILKRPLHDVLVTARAAVASKRKDIAVVARPIGVFEDGFNLYKPVEMFSADDAKCTKFLKAHGDSYTRHGGQYRRAKMAIKVADSSSADSKLEDGWVRIRGVASTVQMDRDGEIVLPSAFEAKIQSFLDNPVMLFNHDSFSPPIGSWETVEFKDDSILLEGVVKDRQIAAIVKRGDIRMLSIGFMIDPEGVTVQNVDGKDTPIIGLGELVETSLVTIPSNRGARFDVIKRVKSSTPDAWIGDCVMDGIDCGCDMPAGVLEYRDLPVCAPGSRFDASADSILRKFGVDGWRTAHSYRSGGASAVDQDVSYHLQVAAIVDGSLCVVPELVRLSMGQIASGLVTFTDSRSKQMVWSMVARRWMDCFPGAAVPTVREMSTDPASFKAIAGDCVGGVCFPAAATPDEMNSWASAHGITGGRSTKEHGMAIYKTVAWSDPDTKGADATTSVTLSDGKRIMVATTKAAVDEGEDPPEEDEDEEDADQKDATADCREDGETEEDCVRRKVPELVEGEGMDEESAATAAAEMCATACAGAEDAAPSEDEGAASASSSDSKGAGKAKASGKGSGTQRSKPAARTVKDLFANLDLDDHAEVDVSREAMRTLRDALQRKSVPEDALSAAIAEIEDALDVDIDLDIDVYPES